MQTLVQDFRAFLMQGNLIALAVAFVIGTAFAALVNAPVADLVTPLIAAVFGEPSFGGLSFEINGSEFLYGDFLNALITFLSIAAAIFFLVLKPAQRVGLVPLRARRARAGGGVRPRRPRELVRGRCLRPLA